MQLSVMERLSLLSILPKEGNFATIRIVRKLRESLSLSEEEHKRWNVRQEGDLIRWDNSGDQAAEIMIGEKANDVIVDALKALNKANKITEQNYGLYERFVERQETGAA